MTDRDDFNQQTKEMLARRVGYRCVNPHCRKPTSSPRSQPSKAVNIGVAAHITAASEGGPRWPYSSYHAHLSDKPTHLQREQVVAWFHGMEELVMSHRPEADMQLPASLVPEDFD
jgi:hypothetical protein